MVLVVILLTRHVRRVGDVPFYADPDQPGCTETADGIDCQDDSIEHCAAGLDLTITTSDSSVHLKQSYEVAIPAAAMVDQSEAGSRLVQPMPE